MNRDDAKGLAGLFLGSLYALVGFAMRSFTFIWLIYDAYLSQPAAWKWLLFVPMSALLAYLWPVYWFIFLPLELLWDSW